MGIAVGAHVLVWAASRLAVSLGLSPLLIGLTLVAWGTSSPELGVSLVAALRNVPELAVGNVIGSNIFNIAIVLGISALVRPIPVRAEVVRRDVSLIVAFTTLLLLLALGGYLSRIDAIVLVAILFAYTFWLYRSGSADNRHDDLNRTARWRSLVPLAVGALGCGLLLVSANWVVDAAVELARILAISDTVVGLTIVALGTSLPELATSTVAAIRGEPEIAIGNVLGSNAFNILGILGITALVSPLDIGADVVHFDIPVALCFTLACVPLMLTAHRISRWEGGLLVASYLLYLALLL